jgi:hypothetical protein
MKKFLFAAIFAFLALASVEVNAQTTKGDVWLGGSSDLGLTFTPDFVFNTALNADYFLMDRLSVGADVDVYVAAQTYIGLHYLNAGVGYWHHLSDNVVISPRINLNDLTGVLGIGTSLSFQVKL